VPVNKVLSVVVSSGPPLKAVPRAVGMRIAEASKLISDRGFQVRRVEAHAKAPAGVVARQLPAPGKNLGAGEKVTLVVSAGPRLVSVPRTVGLDQQSAVARLQDAGLASQLKSVGSAKPAGQVVSQSPGAGSRMARGDTVTLSVSTGVAPVMRIRLDSVTGLSRGDAITALHSQGFRVRVLIAEADAAEGTVTAQRPAAGSALVKGALVSITVAKAAMVDVPDVRGLDEASASRQLREAGFVVSTSTVDTADSAKDGIVVSQNPLPAKQLKKGSTVTIVIGRYSGYSGSSVDGDYDDSSGG
jgi:serine/threonine-protein kinase